MTSAQHNPSIPKRRSRYQQQPDVALPFRFGDLDHEILMALSRFRFMTTDTVFALFDQRRSPSVIRRHLSLLFHHQYVTRRFWQGDEIPDSHGSPRTIHLLDRRGGQYLRSRGLLEARGIDRVRRQRSIHRSNIAHTLAVAEFQFALTRAIETSSAYRLEAMFYDRQSTNHKIRAELHRRYKLEYDPHSKRYSTRPVDAGGESKSRWPDAAFLVSWRGDNGVTNRSFYLVEYDNARRNPRLLFERAQFYQACVADIPKIVIKRYGLRRTEHAPTLRVLFIAPAGPRIHAIATLARLRRYKDAADSFVFLPSDRIDIRNPASILGSESAFDINMRARPLLPH